MWTADVRSALVYVGCWFADAGTVVVVNAAPTTRSVPRARLKRLMKAPQKVKRGAWWRPTTYRGVIETRYAVSRCA
nr:hypothetical protein GCM10017745_08720 [Saccharothrix mutabilis subsp. capreolus]